jgi:hypothetical protein
LSASFPASSLRARWARVRDAVNILAAYDAALAVPGTLFRPKYLDGDYYSIVDCVKASRSGKTLTFSLTPQ